VTTSAQVKRVSNQTKHSDARTTLMQRERSGLAVSPQQLLESMCVTFVSLYGQRGLLRSLEKLGVRYCEDASASKGTNDT
jgi:hypothetical protein